MSGYCYFCPSCYGLDVRLERAPLIIGRGAPEPTASCELCGWKGPRQDLLAGIEPANKLFWTTERVADTLLGVASKYAAGPMLQTLEMLGLLPRIEGTEEQQKSAQAIREHVLKQILGAIVTSAFTAAAEVVPQHYERFSSDMAEATEHIFSYGDKDGQS